MRKYYEYILFFIQAENDFQIHAVETKRQISEFDSNLYKIKKSVQPYGVNF